MIRFILTEEKSMPELPDVQVLKEYFDATSLKKKITEVAGCDVRLLEGVSQKDLRRRLVGKRFSSTRRYGKYLFARLEQRDFLVLHLGMTGFLRAYRKKEKATAHPVLLLRFEDGFHLAFDCRRRLGHISLTAAVADFVRRKELGPDVLEICADRDEFAGRLKGRRGSIKRLLMNQKVMAGIGNIYADEILFRMGLHPGRRADELDDRNRRALAAATCHVLQTAIAQRAGARGWPQKWLLPRREEGEECPRCSGTIRRITVAGRGAYFCPGHQNGQ